MGFSADLHLSSDRTKARVSEAFKLRTITRPNGLDRIRRRPVGLSGHYNHRCIGPLMKSEPSTGRAMCVCNGLLHAVDKFL